MRILIGSSSAQSNHAVVATSASEEASWLTGIALVPETRGQITLSVDADLLGSASLPLGSLSLKADTTSEGNPLEAPSGPVGEQKQFHTRLVILAREVTGSLHVDLELPRQVAGGMASASAEWEEVPTDAHVLLVDAHVMGRAEMLIDHLRVRYV